MSHTSREDSSKEKVLITAALPYANGTIHFGHLAGAYLPADCYARFMRLVGNEVCFICGSDEYGVAISMSAELCGRTPQEHVNIFHEVNKKLFQDLLISFDHYSRTTAKEHAVTTVEFFDSLYKKGFVTPMESEQLYCEQDGRFYADRYVVGTCPKCGYIAARGDECTQCGASYEAIDLINPKTKIGDKPLSRKKTTHWYLRLDLFKEDLLVWINSKTTWKPNVVNFIKKYIEDLKPRAITRDMRWGIPVPLPEAEGKVFYVWFDAPIGYISATKEWASQIVKEPSRWKDFWLSPETRLVQFVGKDNIPFHAVIFPAMIMGQDLPYKLVDDLPANEFYTLDGRQFSKSEGWYIDIQEFLKEFSPELIRYTIAANAPETQDSEFTWKDFQTKINTDLVGKFGNFINRSLVFTKNVCNGMMPDKEELEDIDREFLRTIEEKADAIREAYSLFRLRRACQLIMELAQAGNVYFDAKKPWGANKEGASYEQKRAMRNTIALCIECVKVLSVVASPIMPHTAEKIEKLLGIEDKRYHSGTWSEKLHWRIPAGHRMGLPSLLFKKIEDKVVLRHEEALYAKSSAAQKLPQQPTVQKEQNSMKTEQPQSSSHAEHAAENIEISFDEFQKIALEVVEIIAAEPVPKSKKLLRLDVLSKSGKRQIISGIALHYNPQDLIGKRVVACVNLKPAKLMGLESHGMILAASGESNDLHLVEMPLSPVGTSVH